MTLIDTNVVLRYLLKDVLHQHEIAKDVILKGAYILPETIPELVYTLAGYYRMNRDDIANSLIDFLDDISIENKQIYKKALRYYGDLSLDYVDCVLIARAKLNGDTIITFDKKLKKIIESD
ncbi:MAG: PIN domain-containing protein [Oscillospiraceae bacterium]|nr:PIN domain-containing protein [Oscillospiraceae bacterium]